MCAFPPSGRLYPDKNIFLSPDSRILKSRPISCLTVDSVFWPILRFVHNFHGNHIVVRSTISMSGQMNNVHSLFNVLTQTKSISCIDGFLAAACIFFQRLLYSSSSLWITSYLRLSAYLVHPMACVPPPPIFP